MSVYIHIRVPLEDESRALEAIEAAGIVVVPDTVDRYDENLNARVLTHTRVYGFVHLRHMGDVASIVEYEARKTADSWRRKLQEVIVEILVP